jgi:hypothetical protein
LARCFDPNFAFSTMELDRVAEVVLENSDAISTTFAMDKDLFESIVAVDLPSRGMVVEKLTCAVAFEI